MATNHTPNYNLSQWEPSDPVQRTDFNTDNAKLDAALAALAAEKADASALAPLATKAEVSSVQEAIPHISAGFYNGDGAASRTINLGFTPKAVFVCKSTGETSFVDANRYYWFYGGLAVSGMPAYAKNTPLVSSVSGGFQVYFTEGNDMPRSNQKDLRYHYLAIG